MYKAFCDQLFVVSVSTIAKAFGLLQRPKAFAFGQASGPLPKAFAFMYFYVMHHEHYQE